MGDDGGFVRIFRRVTENAVFRNASEAMAFVFLVMRASWRPTRVRYKDRVIVLERGQVAMSIRDFARHMDRDRNWAERLLKRLKEQDMIETRLETGLTVVTICNYSKYQDVQAAPETVVELFPRQGRDSAETQNNELKEGKKRNNKGRVILPEWLPIPAWEGWLEMRRAMRKPATPHAQELAIKKLEGFRRRGMNVEAALEQSTISGWTDLYEPKRQSIAQQEIPW